MLYINDNKLLNDKKSIIVYQTKWKKKEQYLKVDPVDYIRSHRTGHEGIYGQCSAYFDFDDAVYNTKEHQEARMTSDAKTALENVCGFLEIDESECLVFIASGQKGETYVNALHIIVPSKTYDDGQHLLNEINTHQEWTVHPDKNLYRKAGKRAMLRLPYVGKEKKKGVVDDRVYKLMDVELGVMSLDEAVAKSDPYNWFVQRESIIPVPVPPVVQGHTNAYWGLFVAHDPATAENHIFLKETVEADTSVKINSQRLHSTECDVCPLDKEGKPKTHDNDNTLYLNAFPKSNKLFRGCTRSGKKNMVFVCKLDDADGESAGEPMPADGELLSLDDEPEPLSAEDKKMVKFYMNKLNKTHKTQNSTLKSIRRNPKCTVLELEAPTQSILVFPDGNAFFKCEGQKAIPIYTVKLTARQRLRQMVMTREPRDTKLYEKSIRDGFVNAGLNVKVVNFKYCADIKPFMNSMKNQTYNVIGIRSDMGTGKTTANHKVVEELVRANPKFRVLVISMRMALASKYKEDYEGFVCYLDKDQKRVLVADQLICQLDSLNRVQWVKHDHHLVDMVVIDEATQALKHLVSSTYMKNPNVKNNIAKFRQIIRGAKQVVLMDANLDADTVCRIRYLRNSPTDTSAVFWNKYKVQQRNLKMTGYNLDVIRSTYNNLDLNLRTYIASNNSCESILATKELLQKHKPDAKILAICTDTLHLPEVKEALENPNATWGLYDVVICSPSVQSGVSYDAIPLELDKKDRLTPDSERGLFYSVFGMFGNSTNSSGDACQQLHRVRHPISPISIVSFEYSHLYANHGGGGITDREEYIRYLTRVRNFGAYEKMPKAEQTKYKTLEHMTDFEYNQYNETEFKRNWYFNMFVDFKIAENIDRRDYAQNFVDKQLLYGNTVVMLDCEDTAKVNGKIKKDLTDTKNTRQLAHAVALDTADNITKEQKDAIKKKMNTLNAEISTEEHLQYKKFVLNSSFGMKTPAEGTSWYSMLSEKKYADQFKNINPFINNDSLRECLARVELAEHRAEIKRRQELKDEQEGIWGVGDTETAMIKSLANGSKYKSVKMRMLVGWIEALGFKSLYDDRTIDADDLKEKLGDVHKEYFADASDVCSILGKKKAKMKTLEKLDSDDPKFIKKILKFMNGTLQSTWGIKIVGLSGKTKMKTKPTEYMLVNDNVDIGLFKNPFVEEPATTMFGQWTPVLGLDTYEQGEVLELDDVDDLDMDAKMLILEKLKTENQF